MGVPYEMPPQGNLIVENGSACFALSFPNKTWISKIVVLQTDGTPSNFTVALYNSESACRGQPESESIGGDVFELPPDLYRITPDLAGVAGKLAYFSESENGGSGFQFVSQDRDAKPTSIVGNTRTIFVHITTALPGATTFAVVLGGDTYL